MTLFRSKRPMLDHPYFGRLTYMAGEYWEGELPRAGLPERVGLVVPAPPTGPDEAQVMFCRGLLDDLDALFERCRPLFEPDFEEWAEEPFPTEWSEDFVLTGLGLPARGDERGSRGTSATSSRRRTITSPPTSSKDGRATSPSTADRASASRRAEPPAAR